MDKMQQTYDELSNIQGSVISGEISERQGLSDHMHMGTYIIGILKHLLQYRESQAVQAVCGVHKAGCGPEQFRAALEVSWPITLGNIAVQDPQDSCAALPCIPKEGPEISALRFRR